MESEGTPASAAVDGNPRTRWSSAFSEPQWLRVDLGARATVTRLVLHWDSAYAAAYRIEVSSDARSWTPIFRTTTSSGGVEELSASGTGRYVRLYGTARATGWGFALWEFEVYGKSASTGCNTSRNAALNRPVTASSIQGAVFPAPDAVDGNRDSRWSSEASDAQWIRVDLGSRQAVCRVVLNWEAAYGRAYRLELSDDGRTWSTLYRQDAGKGGTETISASGVGRYLRLYGTRRATRHGYSLWELRVYTRPVGGV
ncbi:discoidin domain-containing protein [Micromonospora fulviviridis]|uniref:Discoidin domain-containing protein n=1 Tax=Micromonospora fulviviridis TaxID=47860 RepID=A0ABV2VUT6_9ACTN